MKMLLKKPEDTSFIYLGVGVFVREFLFCLVGFFVCLGFFLSLFVLLIFIGFVV